MTHVALQPPPAGVGVLLRDWRQRRRRSQLDLALDAGVSAAHLLERVERQLALTGDAELARLRDEVAAYPGPAHEGPSEVIGEIVVPLHLRTLGGDELRFFSTMATFGTAVDTTVAELSIESFFPAGEATARAMREHARTY